MEDDFSKFSFRKLLSQGTQRSKGGIKGIQGVWALLCYFKLADRSYEYKYPMGTNK